MTSSFGPLWEWVLRLGATTAINGTEQRVNSESIKVVKTLYFLFLFVSLTDLQSRQTLALSGPLKEELVVQTSHWRSVKQSESFTGCELCRNHIIRINACHYCWNKLFFLQAVLQCNKLMSSKGVTIDLVNWSPSGYCQDVNKSADLWRPRLV